MEVLSLLMWISLGVVLLALVGYAWSVGSGAFDHSDRLCLLPLDDADAKASNAESNETIKSEIK